MVAGHPTVREIVTRAAERLTRYDACEAGRIAELLASHILGLPRLQLFVNPGLSLNEAGEEAFEQGVERLVQGEPIQYVTGTTEFRGHVIHCDPRALIPRPETEELVEALLADDAVWAGALSRVLDVGTGTGCIAISIALERPGAEVTAVDVSEGALGLASENAQRLGCADRIELVHGQLDELEGTFDAIISNPPYVSTGDCERLDVHVRDHEPASALDGGIDGLDIIRSIAAVAPVRLKPGAPLVLEIGDGQAEAVVSILQGAGFRDVSARRDLTGRERIVRGLRDA